MAMIVHEQLVALREKLEPEAAIASPEFPSWKSGLVETQLTVAAQLSIAVSLKRLADFFERRGP